MATGAGRRSSSATSPHWRFPTNRSTWWSARLSMHHWADPTAGLAEIGRVLRPGGRALVWDFRAGGTPGRRVFRDADGRVEEARVGYRPGLNHVNGVEIAA